MGLRTLTRSTFPHPATQAVGCGFVPIICFWAAICDGEPVLKEHEAAKWLRAEELDSVAWLPADLTIIPLVKEKLTTHCA